MFDETKGTRIRWVGYVGASTFLTLGLSLPVSNLQSMNVAVPFESVYETVMCDHSNESY